jgi:hypothetical protein
MIFVRLAKYCSLECTNGKTAEKIILQLVAGKLEPNVVCISLV